MRKYVNISPKVDEQLGEYKVNFGGDFGNNLWIDNLLRYDENSSVTIGPEDFGKLRDILTELIDALGIDEKKG